MNWYQKLEGRGYPIFNTPQELPHDDLFYDYSRNKINKLSTVFDIDCTMRLFKVDIDGKVTKTLLNEITAYMEQRIRYTLFLIGDKIYYLHKKRLSRGKFTKKIMMINLDDIPSVEYNVNNQYREIVENSKLFLNITWQSLISYV